MLLTQAIAILLFDLSEVLEAGVRCIVSILVASVVALIPELERIGLALIAITIAAAIAAIMSIDIL